MSLPGKKRGFRKTVIDGKEFSWRFNSLIEINPSSSKANKLLVDFGWVDPFLNVNNKSASLPENNPAIATPSLTSQAIEFALKNNWDVTKRTGVMKIVYRDSLFTLSSH